MRCLPLISALNLSPTVADYYSTWVQKARLSQIRQFPNKYKLYLHLIAFIAHQYYLRQDALIDILLKSVQRTKNQVKRNGQLREQAQRKERDQLIKQVINERADIEKLLAEVHQVVHDTHCNNDQKINQLKTLLKAKIATDLMDNSSANHWANQRLQQLISQEAYYDQLESLSVSLQNRVAAIVKSLVFNEKNSDPNILAAIVYYQQHDGQLKQDVPTAFLTKKEQAIVFDQNKKLRVSLYKALLFITIADAIKSGYLNLVHSYRFKGIQEYLISEKRWQQSRDQLLQLAGLSEFSDVNIVLESL